MSRELLDRSSKRVEALLDRFSAFPPTTGARADAEELVRIVSSLHGECLREIVRVLRDELGDRADAVLERCCADPLTASLLVTHGLHPVPLEERVRRAIEALGPELRRENADAELVSVDEDVVSVRVNGMAAVVAAVEQAIHAAAPEVMEVRCIGQTISLLGAR
jgi:Fe-S cluster biogenesis protein NfuA